MPDTVSPSPSDHGRGIAGGALLLLAFVAVGALLSDAPGDRAGAAVFAPLLALALLGAVRTRVGTRNASAWLFALSLAQVAAAVILIATHIGAPRVVLTITALFTAAWLAAAFLLRLDVAPDGVKNAKPNGASSGDLR